MYPHTTNALVFLIKSLFDLYLLVLVVRLILAYAQANYFNPVTRLIVKLTQNIVQPIRRIIPNYKRIEFSTVAVILVLELIKIVLLCLLTVGLPHILLLLEFALVDAVRLLLQTFFYAILIQAILSWLQPSETSMTQVLQQITAPVLRPLQRIIPPLGGFDITPIPALLLLQLLLILLP